LTWNVLHDDGGGVTARSLAYFRRNGQRLGRVLEVIIDRDRLFSMEIHGSEGLMLLSGCNCGYGGEGPNGNLEILKALGVEGVEDMIFHERHVKIDLRKMSEPRK